MFKVHHAFAFDLMLGSQLKPIKKSFPTVTSAQIHVSSLIEKAIKRNGAEGMVECQHEYKNKVHRYKIVATGTKMGLEFWEITEVRP